MTQLRSFEDLRALKARLANLPEVRARIAARAADRFGELAREAFDAKVSVNGDAFGKRADGKPMTLVKSGRLRADAINYDSFGTRVRASVGSVPYGKYQLKHGILPRSLPEQWDAELDAIAGEELALALGGT